MATWALARVLIWKEAFLLCVRSEGLGVRWGLVMLGAGLGVGSRAWPSAKCPEICQVQALAFSVPNAYVI